MDPSGVLVNVNSFSVTYGKRTRRRREREAIYRRSFTGDQRKPAAGTARYGILRFSKDRYSTLNAPVAKET
jgi:hypothetical protein